MIALLFATFLSAIEVTVVGAAMPTVVAQLGGIALYSWVFSAYLLTQTITIPLYGRLADLYGRRKTFVVGVTLFLIGSSLCGLAPTMELLVAARALQGIGGGVVLPLTMTIFGDLYDVSARTKLQGVFSLVWGFSSIVGPLAGGAIVSAWSWRWIFFLNIPFGFASMLVVALLLVEAPSKRAPRLDIGGGVILSLATLALLLALLPAEQRPLSMHWGPLLGLAAILWFFFVLFERRHREPLLPLWLFKQRVHLAANLQGVLLGVALFGMISYVPLYVQRVLGGTPVEAGAMLIPLSFGWTTATIVAGRLVSRTGFTTLIRVGSLFVGLGAVLGYGGVALTEHWLALLGISIYGLGMGTTISSITVSVQEHVGAKQKGIATALTQFSRAIGGAIGVALLGGLISLIVRLEDNTVRLENASVPLIARSLEIIFAVVAVVAVLSAIVGIGLFPKLPPQREVDASEG